MKKVLTIATAMLLATAVGASANQSHKTKKMHKQSMEQSMKKSSQNTAKDTNSQTTPPSSTVGRANGGDLSTTKNNPTNQSLQSGGGR
jgi:ABC-type transporter MlaC component